MTEKIQNPKAFPCHPETARIDDGMDLRDWFAGQALSLMGHPQDTGNAEKAAEMAYQVADAMLAERVKK